MHIIKHIIVGTLYIILINPSTEVLLLHFPVLSFPLFEVYSQLIFGTFY